MSKILTAYFSFSNKLGQNRIYLTPICTLKAKTPIDYSIIDIYNSYKIFCIIFIKKDYCLTNKPIISVIKEKQNLKLKSYSKLSKFYQHCKSSNYFTRNKTCQMSKIDSH